MEQEPIFCETPPPPFPPECTHTRGVVISDLLNKAEQICLEVVLCQGMVQEGSV